jgi:pilus assembly protein CpaE
MQTLTFITLGNNPETLKEVNEALAACGRARVLATWTSADDMVADVIRLRPAAALLILDSGTPEKEFALIRKLSAASPGTAIITAARDASPALILGSMRAGAREFLQIPILADEFETVLNRIAELRTAQDKSPDKRARMIATFSGKGGSGVSFFGTNLAAAMNVPTVLVDLNLQAGDSASFLGLDPKYSMTDFVRNRSRLDDSLIASLITSHSPRLSLVPAPNEAHEAEDIKPDDISEILHMLGQKFECIVLDLPHTFDPITIAALDLADDVLLVLTLDIPGIRSTKRALKVFDNLGYPREKIRIVVNRWSKNIDVELHKVEAHLGEQLIGFVPNDYKKVIDSINLGRPLVQSEPASKITLEIKRIAAMVTTNGHTPSPQGRKRLFRSVFGRQSSTTGLELKVVSDNA